MERRVRPAAKALIIRDGKLLAIKLKDDDGVMYIMPGGGQMPGELLPEAVRREVAEETGLSVTVNDVAFVIEGAQGERHHRVDIVFDCETDGETDAGRVPDQNQIGYEWLDISVLNTLPLYPSRLRRAIMDRYEGKQRSVYLGNENMGDPEITD